MKHTLRFLLFFGSLLLMPLTMAHPGSTDDYSCHICADGDCASWQVPANERHCHIKPTSPRTTTASNPYCPEYSVYTVATQRCECWQGYYARGNRCIQDNVSGLDICREKYGRGALYSDLTRACYCRDGFTMSDGKPFCEEVIVKTPVERAEAVSTEYFLFGTDRFTAVSKDWSVSSRLFSYKGKNIARLSWRVTNYITGRSVAKYEITLWKDGVEVGKATPLARTTSLYFSFEEGVEYLMRIRGLDHFNTEKTAVTFSFEQ